MAEDVTASIARLSVPPVLLAFGLLPPCLREKNSWMCAVCLNPSHSHQRVPEACFYQLHTVAAAVRDRSVKSIHHVHHRLTSAGSNNTCFSRVSLFYNQADGRSSCFCSNLKPSGTDAASKRACCLWRPARSEVLAQCTDAYSVYRSVRTGTCKYLPSCVCTCRGPCTCFWCRWVQWAHCDAFTGKTVKMSP